MDAELKYQQWVSAIDQVQAETGIRDRERAAAIAAKRHPELADAVPLGKGSRRGASAQSGARIYGGNPARDLERRAKQMATEERIGYAQAYVRVLNSDPQLYLAYLEQKQAEIDAVARRG